MLFGWTQQWCFKLHCESLRRWQSNSALKHIMLSACQNPFWKVASWYLSLLKHTTVKLRQKLEAKCRLTRPSPLLTTKHNPTSTYSPLTFDFPPLSALLHLFCFLWSSWVLLQKHYTKKRKNKGHYCNEMDGEAHTKKPMSTFTILCQAIVNYDYCLKSIMPRLSLFCNPIQWFKC